MERLDRIDALIDAEGRRLDLGPVLEARGLTAALLARPAEAADALLLAMTRHRRVRERGKLLLGQWLRAGWSRAELAAAVRAATPADPELVAAELRAAGAPDVTDALLDSASDPALDPVGAADGGLSR